MSHLFLILCFSLDCLHWFPLLLSQKCILWLKKKTCEKFQQGNDRKHAHRDHPYIPMYTFINPSIPLYSLIYHYIPMYTLIYPCIPTYTLVYPYRTLYTHVYPYKPMYILIYPRILLYTIIYHYIPMYTNIYPCIPTYTLVERNDDAGYEGASASKPYVTNPTPIHSSGPPLSI